MIPLNYYMISSCVSPKQLFQSPPLCERHPDAQGLPPVVVKALSG
jgi:hypothetical protein